MTQVASAFSITQSTNPSGEVVFRVAGWLDGKRVRQNFKTDAETKAQADLNEVRRLQGETGVCTAITRLTDEQLHDAEVAVRRIAGKSRPLSLYVDFALANYREPAFQKPIGDAIADHLAAKDHELEHPHPVAAGLPAMAHADADGFVRQDFERDRRVGHSLGPKENVCAREIGVDAPDARAAAKGP